jgi:hypothetical protein
MESDIGPPFTASADHQLNLVATTARLKPTGRERSPEPTCRQRAMRRLVATFIPIIAAIGSTRPTAGAPDAQDVGTLRAESRAPYVHRLTLYDHEGKAINPAQKNAPPYSPRATCSKCHPYDTIRHGWHFNAGIRDVLLHGRPGEPWIYVDARTGTQLPISARRWPGTFSPEQVGLSDWEFTLAFGRQTPGGGPGEADESEIDASRESLRWKISGTREIDCMFCHSADAQHDAAEAARQIDFQNFRWAPTAALGLGVVRGEARKVPDDFDPLVGPSPDHPEQALPTVTYDRARFDADNRAFFNITRRPPVSRCYFCHSVREVEPAAARAPDDAAGTTDEAATPSATEALRFQPTWRASRDVHIAAGMICTDCHRNDIDHLIARGYGGESGEREQPALAALTCEGCHLGTQGASEATVALGGRLGAPRPRHPGIPTLHFEKLTCTACHSGPWPVDQTARVQTSMAHALGLPTKERRADDAPAIYEPVFARQADGKIAPHRLFWPAFWASSMRGQIEPLPVSVVQQAAGKLAARAKGKHPPKPAPLSDDAIELVRTQLTGLKAIDGTPVYVRGNAVRSDGTRNGSTRSAAAAAAYLWPLGHDVRPAAQSLGVRGCTDCHAEGAPFYAGRVGTVPISAGEDPRPLAMHEFHTPDLSLANWWATAFRFRPAMAWIGWISAGVLAAVLALYGFRGLNDTLRRSRTPPAEQPARHGRSAAEWIIYVIAALGLLTLAATGYIGMLGFGAMRGGWLLAHMLAAPLFIPGLALCGLAWAERCARIRRAASFAQGLGNAAFWATLLLGTIAIVSILAAMTPYFGYAQQQWLYDVHRASALGLLIAVAIHLATVAGRRLRAMREGRVARNL